MPEKISQKPSTFAKISSKIKAYNHDIKVKVNKFRSSTEYKSIVGFLGDILMLGLLGTLTLHLFGYPLNVLTVLGVGSGLWLMKDKFVPMLITILNSFRLINISR